MILVKRGLVILTWFLGLCKTILAALLQSAVLHFQLGVLRWSPVIVGFISHLMTMIWSDYAVTPVMAAVDVLTLQLFSLPAGVCFGTIE